MGLYIQPAYGRQYASSKDALKDFTQGKDFKIICGPYMSCRDAARLQREGVKKIILVWAYDTRCIEVDLRLWLKLYERKESLISELIAQELAKELA